MTTATDTHTADAGEQLLYEPDQVKAAATGHWRDIARAIGIGDEYLTGDNGPCPKCRGKDRWRVFGDFEDTGGCICNQCGRNLGDGFALVGWFTGCDFPAAVTRVAEILGLPPTRPQIVATYDYTDEAGELLFQVCRKEPGRDGKPKDFIQRRPDGNGGWLWKTKGVRRALYHLPELVAEPGRSVVVAEGEKDVDNLRRLGVLATCNAGGAGKWKPDHAKFLEGRNVVIIPDRDDVGREHADQVASSLQGIATSVRVVELPGPGKDATDWIAAGGTRDQLVALAKDTPEWKPSDKPAAKPARTRTHQDNGQPRLLYANWQTEASNALRLVTRYGDVLRWCDPWGKWLVWDGKRWKPDDSRSVDTHAKSVVAELWSEVATLAKTTEPAKLKSVWQFVKSSNQANGIRNMLALARCDVAILPATLDTHPWLLNCDNGTVDLRTGTLRPHNKADYITQLCPVAYEPAAKFPTWRGFLETILAGDRDLLVYVQRLVGYCLTGSTREHLLPFLYGVGSNGKSTFVNILLTMFGPDYAIKAPSDLLLMKQHDTHPTERADLYGKRFVACVEAEDGRRLAESLVKELTGGDRVRARRMREDFWEFSATHKIWLAANHKPVVRGTDHGIWRRIKLLPFTRLFWDADKGESGPDELRMDKTVPERLLAELPGILAWSIEGCRQWQQDGLREPDSVRAATGHYRDEMDLVGRFIADCCIVDADATVGATALFTRFKAWCDTAGERGLNQTRFGAQMTERGFESEKVSGGRVVRHGIQLVGDL